MLLCSAMLSSKPSCFVYDLWNEQDKYYSISLRMMKAIWRHVRLVKGFVNTDVAKDGSKRLRIPMALYQEKQRTQHRFNVSFY